MNGARKEKARQEEEARKEKVRQEEEAKKEMAKREEENKVFEKFPFQCNPVT